MIRECTRILTSLVDKLTTDMDLHFLNKPAKMVSLTIRGTGDYNNKKDSIYNYKFEVC